MVGTVTALPDSGVSGARIYDTYPDAQRGVNDEQLVLAGHR